MAYYLMNKDTPWLLFSCERDEYDEVQLNELKWLTELRPLGYADLFSFLDRRKAPKHRKHIEQLLERYGCTDIDGFIRVTHAVSLNDTFWVKEEDSSLNWADVSLYSNSFDEVIANAAFDGAISDTDLSSTSPEFGTDGSYAKCWINDYESCIRFVKDNIQGDVSQPVLDNYGAHKDKFEDYGLCYTTFVGFIADSYYVESFSIDNYSDEIDEAAIVSIYQTNVQTNKLLSDLGIDMPDIKKIDETTFRLTKEEIAILKSKAPYLISMSTIDLAKITIDDVEPEESSGMNIPDPTNEPVIGVIDTLFDKRV